MKGFHIDEGWIMIILLSCLALALTFVDFGLGLVNLAGAGSTTPVTAPAKVAPSEPDRQDEEKLELAARRLREEIEGRKREMGQLQNQLDGQKREREQAEAAAADARQRLDAARQQTGRIAEDLNATRKNAAAQQEDAGRQARQRDSLEARARGYREELARAEQKLKELNEQIAKAKVGNKLGRYQGLASAKNPQIVECHSSGLVLQPEGKHIGLAEMKANKQAFLQAIGREHDAVIFVVRPDGIPAFETAREIAEEHKLKLGYEPEAAEDKSFPNEAGRRLA